MKNPNALDPETLAKIAAALNPKLACEDPAKAIQLARNLLIAADPELAEQEALRAEELQLREQSERYDALFPRSELISVAEAFKASPGHYKTETGFAAALREEKLTTVLQDVDLEQWRKARPDEQQKFVDYIEVTSLRAVEELFRRQGERKKALDRERKSAKSKALQTKFSKKSHGISTGKKRTKRPLNRNAPAKKRKR
jgi:hypothetical protein